MIAMTLTDDLIAGVPAKLQKQTLFLVPGLHEGAGAN